MRVCIDRSALGTPSSLAVNFDSSCEWYDGECDIHLHNREWRPVQLDALARIQGISTGGLELADPQQVRAFESLGINPSTVPWARALRRDRLSARIRAVSQSIQVIIRDPELRRYVKTYRQGREFLRCLQRPTIDIELLRDHRENPATSASVASTLLSFSPDETGLAPEIEYDQTSTSTGRLLVTSGPRVLTLPKEHRDIIRSAQGGSIFEVDFVSLEPRLALLLAGGRPPRDIYEDVRDRLDVATVSRSDVKLAVISALYGSSSAALAGTLGGRSQARALVDEVKDLFRVNDLVARLRSHMTEHGDRLHSWFGRPLREVGPNDGDSKLVSHYIQSSAVDVSLLGFSQLSDRVHSLGARPIYVIHDAVLFDVPPGAEEALHRECEKGIDLELGHFELGIKRVT
jgi:hypothetical protein